MLLSPLDETCPSVGYTPVCPSHLPHSGSFLQHAKERMGHKSKIACPAFLSSYSVNMGRGKTCRPDFLFPSSLSLHPTSCLLLPFPCSSVLETPELGPWRLFDSPEMGQCGFLPKVSLYLSVILAAVPTYHNFKHPISQVLS